MKRYILVGGNPITVYTGTTTFTSLRVVGSASSKEDIRRMYEEHYEECCGLMTVIDAELGKECQNLLSVDELFATVENRCKVLSLNEQASKYIKTMFKFGLNDIDSGNRVMVKRSDSTTSMWFSAVPVFAAVLGFEDENPLSNSKFKDVWDTFFVETKNG